MFDKFKTNITSNPVILHISSFDSAKLSPMTDVFLHSLFVRSHNPLSGMPLITGGFDSSMEQSGSVNPSLHLHVPKQKIYGKST